MPCCPVLLSYVNDHTDVLFEQINDDDDDDDDDVVHAATLL